MFEPTKLGQKLPWNSKRYILVLFIFALSCSKYLISNYYQPYVYKPISVILRFLSGIFGIAMGEWVYFIICISLIISLIKWIIYKKVGFRSSFYWKLLCVRSINGAAKLYIIFELLWGLNYQKQSPASQFKIDPPLKYTEAQMDSLSLELIQQMNFTRSKLSDATIKGLNFTSIVKMTKSQYDLITTSYPFLKYHQPSIKKAQFPSLGDYIGFTAFYQPITGEAIVRGDLPILTLPFTMSHEIAHQLGYASETEANFIAFVIGTESREPLFNYSTQLQLFTYAQQAHLNSIAKRGDYQQFEKIIARNKQLLSPLVISDRKQIRNFFLRKQELLIPGSTQLYNQFLQWNHQAKGIESYNDVLLWALVYKKKN
jgi:hypothetical protein